MIVEEEISIEQPLSSEEIANLTVRHGVGSRRWFSAVGSFDVWRYRQSDNTFSKECSLIEVTAWDSDSPKVTLW